MNINVNIQRLTKNFCQGKPKQANKNKTKEWGYANK